MKHALLKTLQGGGIFIVITLVLGGYFAYDRVMSWHENAVQEAAVRNRQIGEILQINAIYDEAVKNGEIRLRSVVVENGRVNRDANGKLKRGELIILKLAE